MKKTLNLKAVTNYRELLEEDNSLKQHHPGLQRMQELSAAVSGREPTAITRLEVYKECYRLADDLYRLTGSKRIFAHVLRIGNLLLSRIFSDSEEPAQVNQ